MKRGIIIELVPDRDFDFSEVVVDYANGRPVDLRKCKMLLHPSVIDSFKPEFIEYIVKHGYSALIRRGPLLEYLVPPGTSPGDISNLIASYLSGISVKDELVIVDPYFYAATKDSSYPGTVASVLSTVLPSLKKITVVTLPNKVDSSVKASIDASLRGSNKGIVITSVTSTEFHDRFWLNPSNGRGFLTGTSLNGLGKRYALIDYLIDTDAANVIAVLQKNGLL